MAQRMVPSSGGGAMNIGLSQEPTPAKVKMVSAAGVLFEERQHAAFPFHPRIRGNTQTQERELRKWREGKRVRE